ncbi:hypothetical protein DICA0_F23134 [Diutina catenulata]
MYFISLLLSPIAAFTLFAVENGVGLPVTVSNTQLAINIGDPAVPAQFELQEPEGFVRVDGQYLTKQVPYIGLTDDQAQATRDWGITDGVFRQGPSSDQTVFWKCGSSVGWYDNGGCSQITLQVV